MRYLRGEWKIRVAVLAMMALVLVNLNACKDQQAVRRLHHPKLAMVPIFVDRASLEQFLFAEALTPAEQDGGPYGRAALWASHRDGQLVMAADQTTVSVQQTESADIKTKILDV